MRQAAAVNYLDQDGVFMGLTGESQTVALCVVGRGTIQRPDPSMWLDQGRIVGWTVEFHLLSTATESQHTGRQDRRVADVTSRCVTSRSFTRAGPVGGRSTVDTEPLLRAGRDRSERPAGGGGAVDHSLWSGSEGADPECGRWPVGSTLSSCSSH